MKIEFQCIDNTAGNVHLRATDEQNGGNLYMTLQSSPGTAAEESQIFEAGKLYEITIAPK